MRRFLIVTSLWLLAAAAGYATTTCDTTGGFTPAPGNYSGAQSVALQSIYCSADTYGYICYTTDGSTPTGVTSSGTCSHGAKVADTNDGQGDIVLGTFTVSVNVTVKAIRCYHGSSYICSSAVTGSYTMGTGMIKRRAVLMR